MGGMCLVRRSLGKNCCEVQHSLNSGSQCGKRPLQQPTGALLRLTCYTSVYKLRQMDTVRIISGRRALALLGCVALLYFAGGGAFVHQHTGGSDTPCHVCHSLHVPTLAAAPLDLVHEARQISRHAVVPDNVSPLDSFATHRASRAPPSA